VGGWRFVSGSSSEVRSHRSHGRVRGRHNGLAVLVMAMLALAGAAGGASADRVGGQRVWRAADRFGSPLARVFGSAGASGSLSLGASPGVPVANPKTDTVYVPLQCGNPSMCSATPGRALDVLRASSCTAAALTSCRVVARAVVGESPLAAVIAEETDTVYVADGSGNVSVVNGARCNARVTSGCSKPLAAIHTGGFPVAAAYDPATGTVYVASLSGKVFVIDAAECNSRTTEGCGEPVKAVSDSRGPDGVAVDVATDTVYAANSGIGGDGHTVSVIDGATCNGGEGGGCGQTPRLINVGNNPFWDVVDQATDTVYVANFNDGTVSVIDGASCNAKVTSGCGQTPPTVRTGSGVAFLVLDTSRHTVFALNQSTDTMSAIDTTTCSGTSSTGCPVFAADEGLPFNPPSGGNANAFAFVPSTGTAYLVNVGGEDFLKPARITGCSAIDSSGCRVEAPTVPDPEFFPVVDATTHTIYAGDIKLPQVDVFNAGTCNAGHLSGCAAVAEIPMPHPQPNLAAIDDTTHTLYASDPFGNTISVINTATCNAGDTAGCAHATPKITTGDAPGPPVLDTATHTLYAPFGSLINSNRVAVINAATCNAQNSTGCGQHPASVRVGHDTFLIALSQATNTIYAPSTDRGTVELINGARCNASDHSACRVATSVRVGPAPSAVAVNDATHTVYVSNSVFGDSPGTVSMIKSDTCNGARIRGCDRSWPTVAVGRSPNFIAINSATGVVYVSDPGSAAISIIHGKTCNALTTSDCPNPAPELPIAGSPDTIAIDEQTNTVYAETHVGFAPNGVSSMSIFAGAP
jgi:DNA-binding beta-propeller fold protein YncE